MSEESQQFDAQIRKENIDRKDYDYPSSLEDQDREPETIQKDQRNKRLKQRGEII